jgi:hypothetical protein
MSSSSNQPNPNEIFYANASLQELADVLDKIADNPQLATTHYYVPDEPPKPQEQREDKIEALLNPILVEGLHAAARSIRSEKYLSQQQIADVMLEQVSIKLKEYARDTHHHDAIAEAKALILTRDKIWQDMHDANIGRMQEHNNTSLTEHEKNTLALQLALQSAVKYHISKHIDLAYEQLPSMTPEEMQGLGLMDDSTGKSGLFDTNLSFTDSDGLQAGFRAAQENRQPPIGFDAGNKPKPGDEPSSVAAWARKPRNGPGRKRGDEGSEPRFGRDF